MARPEKREGEPREDTDNGLMDSRWNIRTIGVSIKGYAFLSGVGFTFLLFLLGNYLEIWRIEFLALTKWVQALAALYAGISTGFYLGRAAEDEGEELDVDSFLFGFFISLSVGLVLSAQLLTLTAILAVSFIVIAMLYRTDLVRKGNEFEQYIDYMRRFSLVVFIVLISYNIVLAVTNGQPMESENQLTSIIAVLGIALVLLILPEVFKVPKENS